MAVAYEHSEYRILKKTVNRLYTFYSFFYLGILSGDHTEELGMVLITVLVVGPNVDQLHNNQSTVNKITGKPLLKGRAQDLQGGGGGDRKTKWRNFLPLAPY